MAFGDMTRGRRNGDNDNLARRQNGAGYQDPFVRLQQEMNDLFSSFFGGGVSGGMTRAGQGLQDRQGMQGGIMQSFRPRIDVNEQGDNIIVNAELPGMSADDVEVSLEEDHLTIKGEKRQESKVEEEGYFRSERSFGSFRRTIGFPSAVNTDKAKANFKNGVLTVTLPKVEGGKKAKKLNIKEG